MIIHTVTPGDTVYSIAQKYGVSPGLLTVNNGLSGIVDALPPGLGLVILRPARTYTVRQNDTLRAVAARFGVTLGDLYRRNLILGGEDLIYPGQTLVIDYDEKPVYDFEVGGYAYPFVTDPILNSTLPFMKRFMPFTYGFTASGALVPLDDERLIARAYRFGIQPYLHLSTLTEKGTFDSALAGTLLENRTVWQTLSDHLFAVMKEKGYTGLDIDFEYLPAEKKTVYPEFLAYIREKAAVLGFPLIVALPPKVSDDQPGLLYEGVDYRLIGEAADFCLLMTYEWGYTYGPPMPVSPTPSIRRVLEYAVTEIPREKIYMGISNYGYDWPLPYVSGETRARSLSNTEAVLLASDAEAEIFYSETYDAPFFNYTDAEGTAHEVWFEDARSIAAKLALIDEYAFHGGLYWNLNRRNPQNLACLSVLMWY